jgi:hypothetical protein
MKFTDRALAVVVEGFLGTNNKIFTELFPQYKPDFEKLTAIQDSLVDSIIQYMIKNDKAIINGAGDHKVDDLDSIPNNHVQYFAEFIQKRLKSTINLGDSEMSKIHIKGIINNPTFTNIYISLLTTQTPQCASH